MWGLPKKNLLLNANDEKGAKVELLKIISKEIPDPPEHLVHDIRLLE